VIILAAVDGPSRERALRARDVGLVEAVFQRLLVFLFVGRLGLKLLKSTSSR